jgi:hypothetical protein
MPAIDDPEGEMEPFAGGTGVRIFTRAPGRIAQEIGVWATRQGLRIESIATRTPSLEEVFLAVTGPRARGAGAGR